MERTRSAAEAAVAEVVVGAVAIWLPVCDGRFVSVMIGLASYQERANSRFLLVLNLLAVPFVGLVAFAAVAPLIVL